MNIDTDSEQDEAYRMPPMIQASQRQYGTQMEQTQYKRNYEPATMDSNTNNTGSNTDENQIKTNINVYITAINKNNYDRQSWFELISVLNSVEFNDSISALYERAVKQFPYSANFWESYISRYMTSRNYNPQIAESLFRRCVLPCCNPELWLAYIDFLKKTKLPTENNLDFANNYHIILNAYKEAIQNVGFFIDSNELWKQYISFIELVSKQVLSERENMERELCSVLKKACITAIHNNDSFSRQFTQLGTKLKLEDSKDKNFQTKCENTKKLYTLRCDIWKLLDKNYLAVPSFETKKDKEQLHLWYEAIDLEKQNLCKDSIESNRLIVQNTILRALTCFSYVPELWYESAVFDYAFDPANTLKIFESSLKFIPESHYMYNLICDYYESKEEYTLVNTFYERGLKQINDGYLIVPYLKYTLRHSGPTAMRKLFTSSLKENTATMQLFVTAANLEYYANHEKEYALNIYRRGMTYYSKEPEYILEFITFLMSSGDLMNTKMLIEAFLKEIQDVVEEKKQNENYMNSLERLFQSYIHILNYSSNTGSSINDIFRIEKLYQDMFPKKTDIHGALSHFMSMNQMSYIKRTIEDEGVYKRKYPDPEVITEIQQVQVLPKSKPSKYVPMHSEFSVPIPDELKIYMEKLPPNTRAGGRQSHVDIILRALENELPKKEDYLAKVRRLRQSQNHMK